MSSRWPALPKEFQGAGGRVRVRLVKREKADDGRPAWGTWEPATRIIRIVRGSPPQHRWKVFYHEWMHACLHDSGIEEQLSDEGNEAMCQAYAAARMAEMLAQMG